MGFNGLKAAYISNTISIDVRGIRNAGWTLMIQRVYHKDVIYLDMGYEPNARITALPKVVPILRTTAN